MDKKVSCIIPAYNEEKTITDTIKTALETPEIGEVIVVNDGSEDNTKEKVSNFQSASQQGGFSNFHKKKNFKFVIFKAEIKSMTN